MLAQIGPEQDGTCIWCCEIKRGLPVEFTDGLKGFLCWKDFRNAVKTRSNRDSNKTSKSDQNQPAVQNE